MSEESPPPEMPPVEGRAGTRTAVAAAVTESTTQPLPAISELGPARKIDGQAAALSFQVRPKFAQSGTYTSLELAVFVTDYYPAGNAQARDAVFDELVQWSEAALERQAQRFNEWRHSMGHTGTWGPKS